MNAKQLIAAFAVLTAAGSASAQFTEHVAPDANFVSTKTRAQVISELNQAYAEGTLVTVDGANYPSLRPAPSSRTREVVRAEVLQAPRNVGGRVNGDLYFGD
ncbi:MAG: hypothetical protein JWQ23_4003 [Herminiimonas sp.]|jgi:hypothetical protein|nr:hypothetical protein [Herminiimonas sp.]